MTGQVKLNTPSAGSVTLSPADTASNVTVTIPAATATLVDASSTQTLTNKTMTAAGGNAVEATSGPTSTQLAGMRNKIINGAMMIDQRNAGAAVSASGSWVVDRMFSLERSGYTTLAVTAQQVTDAPSNQVNSVKINVSTGQAVSSSGNLNALDHRIEGYNFADMGFGTANAKSFTLSFWVKSSVVGTYPVSFFNSGVTRAYLATYTINSANTWEYKTIVVAGDTSGTWNTTNGIGLGFQMAVSAGSNNYGTAGSWGATYKQGVSGMPDLGATTGATFYITGVQLEKGATATPFENRLYGTELALCQRYCYVQTNDSQNYRWFAQGYVTSSTTASLGFPLPQVMRSAPSFASTDVTKFIVDASWGATALTSLGLNYASSYYARLFAVTAGGLTTNAGCALASNGDFLLRSVIYSAEL